MIKLNTTFQQRYLTLQLTENVMTVNPENVIHIGWNSSINFIRLIDLKIKYFVLFCFVKNMPHKATTKNYILLYFIKNCLYQTIESITGCPLTKYSVLTCQPPGK